jgi:rhamnosyltransferase
MKIAIIGSKGIPAKYGGFETFAEKISYEFQQFGHNVIVFGDSSSETKLISKNISNVSIKIFKGDNPIKFWHRSIYLAKKNKPDVIIHCGVAGIFSHLYYYSLNDITYINPDGLGFMRSKYGYLKKIFLFTQFITCSIFAKNIICDSQGIKLFFTNKLQRKKNLSVAEYGTILNIESEDKKLAFQKFNTSLNLNLSNGYFLVIARLEPENNIKLILESYLQSNKLYPLLIVGGKETNYFQKHLKYYDNLDNIHFSGGIYDSILLQSIRINCTAYIHGHTVGGTNPSLIEAMGSRNLIIAHKNEFNSFILEDAAFYFKEIDELVKIFNKINKRNTYNDFRSKVLKLATEKYSWRIICKKYLNIISND